MSHAPSGHDTNFVSRPSPCRACTACRVMRVAAPLRRVTGRWRHIAACIKAILRHKIRPQPRYNFLYRNSLASQVARTRALRHAPARGPTGSWPFLAVSWPMSRPYLRQARSCRGLVLACPCAPLRCQPAYPVTIQFVVL